MENNEDHPLDNLKEDMIASRKEYLKELDFLRKDLTKINARISQYTDCLEAVNSCLTKLGIEPKTIELDEE